MYSRFHGNTCLRMLYYVSKNLPAQKIVCIPEHDTSRGHSLIGIPSPAGSSGRFLCHHSQEALAFTCFFCLSVIPFIAASHSNDAMLKASEDGSRLSWAFCEIVSPLKKRCYGFSLCSSALIKFQAF